MRKFSIITVAVCLTVFQYVVAEQALAAEEKAKQDLITVTTPQPEAKASDTVFVGDVNVSRLLSPQIQSTVSGGYVTFRPGARTNWHIHPQGQLLIVTNGKGLVQQWEEAATEIKEGDIVWIPAGVKHWHGASPDSEMTHTAIAPIVNGKSTDWLEKVTDEQYTGK